MSTTTKTVYSAQVTRPETTPTVPTNGSYKWFAVGLLWFVCLLNYADRQAIFALFPLLRDTLHLDKVQLGIIGSSFMWMYALCGPFAGWVGDRASRKKLILGGLLLWTALALLTSTAHNFWQLAALRGITGLGEALYFPAAMSLISALHGPETRSRAMAVHQSAVYVGSIGGGAVGGWVGQHHGWRTSFVAFACAGLLVAVTLILFLREPGRDASLSGANAGSDRLSLLQSVRSILRNTRVVRLIIAFIGANFVAMVFMSWFPTYLHDRFGMSLTMAGLSGTIFIQAASVAGVLTGGFAADRAASRHKGGRIATQAAGLALGVVFLFFSGFTRSVPWLMAAMIGFGFAKGIYDANIFASLYDLVPQQQRSSAAGLLNSLGWLGGGFAPLAIAYASARLGMGACLSITSLVYLAMSLLLFQTAGSLARASGGHGTAHTT